MISTEFIITSLIVVLIPGTGVIYTISTGLFKGSRASVFAATGCTLGIVPHIMASVLGLATILHMSAMAFQVVKFIGVAYLLYLAWSMWQQSTITQFQDEANKPHSWRIALKGFLTNILNPKLSLFFLAFLPQFISASATTPVLDMLFLGGIFMAMTLVIFIAYGLFANSVRIYVMGSPRIIKRTQRCFAGIFVLLGAKLAMAER